MLIHREEIDGLRCIAVIPVIFYHAGLRMYFSGGYVGVDIFFVISGYLITSIIINECEEGNFSLINFYERRCRRILPALCLILFFSSFCAYHLMLPEQLKEFSETLLSIIFLSSNIYFWWKDDGYFSQLSELNPLVHTWSLAVEEQFYLIFPIVCYLLYRKQRHLIVILISVSVMSLVLSQWGGNIQIRNIDQFQMFSQHPLASFYLPIGRIWELLLGALVAFYSQSKNSDEHRSKRMKQLYSLFGLCLIIISVVFFDTSVVPSFPNVYTLVPTCGASLIILNAEQNTFVGYLLSIRLFRWIGLISYSAYLWHQPLLAFLRLQSNEVIQNILYLIVIIIVFPLSVLSYLFVEQPFRNRQRFSRHQIFLFAGLASVLILCNSLFLIQTGNDRLSAMDKGNDTYLSDLKRYGHWGYVIQNFDPLAAKKKHFLNQTTTLNRKVIVIGDSFARDFYNMIIEGKHMKDWDFCAHFVDTRCQIYLGKEDRRKFIEAKYKQRCTNAYDIKDAFPLIRQANLIILSSYWRLWSAERLPNTLKLLNLTKEQQLIVLGSKNLGKVNPKLYVNKPRSFRIKQFQYPDPAMIHINQLLEKTIDPSIYVNVQNMICTGFNQSCPLFTPHGKLISYDGVHLTKYGALFIGNILFKNKPFNKFK